MPDRSVKPCILCGAPHERKHSYCYACWRARYCYQNLYPTFRQAQKLVRQGADPRFIVWRDGDKIVEGLHQRRVLQEAIMPAHER